MYQLSSSHWDYFLCEYACPFSPEKDSNHFYQSQISFILSSFIFQANPGFAQAILQGLSLALCTGLSYQKKKWDCSFVLGHLGVYTIYLSNKKQCLSVDPKRVYIRYNLFSSHPGGKLSHKQSFHFLFLISMFYLVSGTMAKLILKVSSYYSNCPHGHRRVTRVPSCTLHVGGYNRKTIYSPTLGSDNQLA